MDSERSIDVSDPKLPSIVLERLQSFRKDGLFCDFTINVAGVKFEAHRSVLASCSDYFKAMLTINSIEAQRGEVTLRHISSATMDEVLNFFYTSKAKFNLSNAHDIIHAASFLQAQQLLDLVVNYVEDILDICNCVSLLNIADQCNIDRLRSKAKDLCLEQFNRVVTAEEFCYMEENLLAELIDDDELDVDDDLQVFNAVIKWIDFDGERRPKLLGLLKRIRLLKLKPSSLIEISKHPYICESSECRDICDMAKDYQLLQSELRSVSPDNDEHESSDDKQMFGISSRFLRRQPRQPQRLLQRIYALGGWTNNLRPIETMEIYNPYTDTWSEGPPMSKARCGVGAAIFDDQLYAVGGHDGMVYLNSIERFDIKTNTWHQDVEPMSSARSSVGVVALDGYLYTIGGQSSEAPLSDVERYNLKTKTWERLAPMHEKRLGAGVTVLNGLIYVVGGCAEQTRICNSVEIYHPERDWWEIVSCSYLFPRKHLGCTTLKGSIYAVGGRGESGELNLVAQYSPDTNVWSGLPNMKTARSGIGLLTLDDKIYAIGGHDGDQRLNVVEVFDPELGEWSNRSPMHRERLGGGYAVYSKIKTK